MKSENVVQIVQKSDDQKSSKEERVREENGVDRLFFGRLPSDWNFTSSCENILVKLYLFLMFFVSRVRKIIAKLVEKLCKIKI